MVKTSSTLIGLGAASLLGVALAAGAAHAATGALSAADAPGQVLQVTGVGPASAQASATAIANANANANAKANAKANANAEGLSGATTARATTAPPTPGAAGRATAPSSVRQVARPAPQMLPAYHEVMHSGEMTHGWTGLNGTTSTMR